MISLGHHTKVYLAAGPTDMRRAIDGLAALVEDVLEQDPLSSYLFVFCNRRRDKLKLLFWQHNGFWLWYRRLEPQRFWWPDADDEAPCLELSLRELGWLLDGLDLSRVEAHRKADLSLI